MLPRRSSCHGYNWLLSWLQLVMGTWLDVLETLVMNRFPTDQFSIRLHEFLPVTRHVLHPQVVHDKLTAPVQTNATKTISIKRFKLSQGHVLYNKKSSSN